MIERADGSDQSILAKFEIGENISIGGAGWSPSGKWFSWNVSGSPVVSDAHVVNRNESQIRSLFDSRVQLRKVEWSPTEDILLVHYSNMSGSVDNIIVYDPNIGQIVFQMRGEELHPVTLETQLTVSWSPDGSQLVILDYIDRQLYLVEHESWEITHTVAAEGTSYNGNNGNNDLPQWLDNDHLIYISLQEDQLLILNILTNETIER